MKAYRFIVAFVMLALTGAARSTEKYQAIIARDPFGTQRKAAQPVEAAPAAAVMPSAIGELRLTAIVENPWGLTVGIVDTKANNKAYFLDVGASQDGIEVLEADYTKEGALVRRGSEQAWIYMNQPGSGGGAASTKAGRPALPGLAALTASRAPRRYVPATPPTFRGLTKEQYAKIKDKLPPPTPPGRTINRNPNAPASTNTLPQGKDMEKWLQDYNLELIRARGDLGPALPIPLTPEQDAQLVKEGVLPKQEETAAEEE